MEPEKRNAYCPYCAEGEVYFCTNTGLFLCDQCHKTVEVKNGIKREKE